MNRSARPLVILAGSLAQRPGIGGHACVFLQYLLGFRELGCDVLFLDSLSEDMCHNEQGERVQPRDSWNVTYLLDVLRAHGLEQNFSLQIGGASGQVIGRPRRDVLSAIRSSVVLINVMGYLTDAAYLAAAPRRAFLDIDPGFGQFWKDLGWADIFAGHDRYVTVGLNVGQEDCRVPTCGLKWVTTLPPVVLSEWPDVQRRTWNDDSRVTSVVSWRGPFGPVTHGGVTYGLRCHEFRKFIGLPAITGGRFELAIDIHPNDFRDSESLDAGGWQRVSPMSVARTPGDYRQYVQQSAAEFMVAKNLYVASRGGWFSDRTACYLASGRPAIVQDTGLSRHLPIGRGLLSFSDLSEAAEAVRRIRSDYAAHARHASEIANDLFDAKKVLPKLLDQIC